MNEQTVKLARYQALLKRIERMCEEENLIYQEIRSLDIEWLIDDYYGHPSQAIQHLQGQIEQLKEPSS